MALGGSEAEVIDLPGTYSLAAASPDERVVMDVLGGRNGHEAPDLLVCVVDATNLKRNLFLVSQAAELGLPMVIALNQWDAAKRNGMVIDHKLLSERLGIPVVPTVAKRGQGVPELCNAIEHSLRDPRTLQRIQWPTFVEEATEIVANGLAQFGGECTPVEARRLLFDTDSVYAAEPKFRERISPFFVQRAKGFVQQDYNPPRPRLFCTSAIWRR